MNFKDIEDKNILIGKEVLKSNGSPYSFFNKEIVKIISVHKTGFKINDKKKSFYDWNGNLKGNKDNYINNYCKIISGKEIEDIKNKLNIKIMTEKIKNWLVLNNHTIESLQKIIDDNNIK